LAGCGGSGGPALYAVKGTVTYNGKPLEGANVNFVPTASGGQQAVGTTDAKGQYILSTLGRPGAVLGEHMVTVTKFSAGSGPANPKPEDMMKMQRKGAVVTGSRSEIPSKYGMTTTSGFKFVVGKDTSKNVFDLPLTD
jgi:hypothetical protein